jgi:hypothetical protein
MDRVEIRKEDAMDVQGERKGVVVGVVGDDGGGNH